MGYIVKDENSQTGEVSRRGPFVTEQEARRYPPSDSESRSDGYSGALGNLVEQAYDFDPQLATANVRQEVEDAVRDGRKDCRDAKGNLVCRYTIEQE